MTTSVSDRVSEAVNGAGSDPTVRAAVGVAAVVAAMPPPDMPADVGFIWKSLIIGLLVLLVIALGGIVFAVSTGKPTDVFVTIFTTVFAGLIGLFVKSPTNK